jgi:hypothetical protein
VLLLVLPYLLFLNSTNPQVDKWIALGIMLATVIIIIAGLITICQSSKTIPLRNGSSRWP